GDQTAHAISLLTKSRRQARRFFVRPKRGLAFALDAECLHARAERSGLDAQELGRAISARNFPFGSAQGGDDVVALQRFELFSRAHALEVYGTVWERHGG